MRTDNPIGQICQKACTQDQDCVSKRKCLCDGDCGMSCVTATRSCPWPVNIDNAETKLIKGTRNFGDQISVDCHPGFKMARGRVKALSHCQGDRKWSVTASCYAIHDPVKSCDAPPSLENGYVSNKASSFSVGTSVHYQCNLGFALEGHAVTECMENTSWSHPSPTCREIFCPPPPEVNGAYLVAVQKSEYTVFEEINYLCDKTLDMDGTHSVTCEPNGNWSVFPICRVRCNIPAQRSRVIYNGKKLWATEITIPVHHLETVTFFCKNETCSYPATSWCFDGTLSLPQCYEEPTWMQYNFFAKNIASEMTSCSEI
uniref:Beta-2-glycoprotein 1 n=1 Tax=Leptobrachium leishanense TaxID=445787 RepID=A0A8C5PJK4_9ANUR